MTHILRFSEDTKGRLLGNTENDLLSYHLIVIVAELWGSALCNWNTFRRFLSIITALVLCMCSNNLLTLCYVTTRVTIFVWYSPADNMLLILLKSRFHLKAFLQIEESCIFETTIAH